MNEPRPPGIPASWVNTGPNEWSAPGSDRAKFIAGSRFVHEAVPPASQTHVKKVRLRQSQKPLMNKLETRFLAYMMAKYPGVNFHPQGKTYRLANGLQSKPDFSAILNGVETVWEVKGKWVDGDSFPKLKMFASIWSEIDLFLAWEDGREWRFQKILP